MTTFDASRRQFLKRSVIAGVSVYVANLGSPAFASLFEDKVLAPTDDVWRAGEGMRFRLDGIAKVTGSKVFARDIRARDMPSDTNCSRYSPSNSSTFWRESAARMGNTSITCAITMALGVNRRPSSPRGPARDNSR